MKRQYLKSDRNFEKNQVEFQELRTRKKARIGEKEEGGKELGKE